MVKTLTRLDKLRALQCVFKQRGMLVGTVAEYMSWQFAGTLPPIRPGNGALMNVIDSLDNCHIDGSDTEPVSDPKSETEIWLAARHQTKYPSNLTLLAAFIEQPKFPLALQQFIHNRNHPNSSHLGPVDDSFDGPIRVFHSAKVQFYAPSDLCGTVARDIPCALVTWFVHPDDDPKCDEISGMWKVCPERDGNGQYPVQVIHLDTILRGVSSENMTHNDALDAWDTYFVNQFIDYHAHELLT
ncbi:hypothetical protein BGY98DRAFT_1052077 [Russula aff. rugulosa BPL654]|nr:hypothetical protein BGY98DRAFT_1052077 [Russula aff. rugulosa BPL654]